MMTVEQRAAQLGWVGAPVGAVQANGRLRWGDFANGVTIVESPMGTFVVMGAIRAHYMQHCGGPGGALGAPLTDEIDAGDGVGRLNEFEGGSIVWSQVSGAHEVHGDIRAQWQRSGGVRGPLGYPVTDELGIDTGNPAVVRRYQFFTKGALRWSPETGTVTGCWPERLFGFADTHAHPAAHLGFGHLIHGAVEGPLGGCEPTHGVAGTGLSAGGLVAGTLVGGLVVGSIAPDPISLTNMLPAVAAIGGGRAAIIAGMEESFGHRTHGDPEYDGWPSWRSRLHQQIHLDWLRRSYDHGQRLVVSLAVGHELLSAVAGDPQTDMQAMVEQTKFVADLARRHSDWMAVARTPDEARAIVASNRLAIILGVEVDFLGEFQVGRTAGQTDIDALVNELFDLGIRYVFPIHLSDNAFGGMAIYDDMFTIASTIVNRQATVSQPNPAIGNAPSNVVGLQDAGERLLRTLIGRGMLIDVDHMSMRATDRALAIAEETHYPLVSGHATFLELAPSDSIDKHSRPHESRKSAAVLERLRALGSFVGVQPVPQETRDTDDTRGRLWNDSPGSATTFARELLYAAHRMDGRVAIGTDLNGLANTSTPRFGPGAGRILHERPDLRRSAADAQTNGVRYSGPIVDTRAERLDPGEHYLTDDERASWRVVLLWDAGRGDIGAAPWQGILEGLRAGSRPADGDRLVGWIAKSGENIGTLPADKQRFAQIMRATIGRWNATKGANPPLTRCLSGTHDFDYNLEGLAHYGMLPDFFMDVANHGLSWDTELFPMLRSAQTVVETWEKCTGARARGPEQAPRDARTIVPAVKPHVNIPTDLRR